MSHSNRYFTFTKSLESIDDISPNFISIIDIAHSLSLQCRFNGHCPVFYSVAEHSVLVMKALNDFKDRTFSIKLELAALLHDANECYVGDIIRPLSSWLHKQDSRNSMAGYSIPWLKAHVRDIIYESFGISLGVHESTKIREMDDFLLNVEGSRFFGKAWTAQEEKDMTSFWQSKIQNLSPGAAEKLFLKEFADVYERYVDKGGMAAKKT